MPSQNFNPLKGPIPVTNPILQQWLDPVLIGVAIGAYYALPDYIENRAVRIPVTAAVMLAGIAGVVVTQETDVPEDLDPARAEPLTGQEKALAAATVAATAGYIALDKWLWNTKVAGWLRDKGCRKPNTLLGLVFGGLSLVAAKIELADVRALIAADSPAAA
ncbi:MAG: hypothetical protein SPI77_02635 [Corynebacterium sp.]|nr:hypothetical protein [Corynebacterium sp.]